MKKLKDIQSMGDVRDVITDILVKVDYNSPNREIINWMCSDTLEILLAYIICVEESDHEEIKKLNSEHFLSEPTWNSLFDLLLMLPSHDLNPRKDEPDFYGDSSIDNWLTQNMTVLSHQIAEIVLDDNKTESNSFPNNLLLSAFYTSDRLCNILPTTKEENALITEYRFALMEIARVLQDLE